MTLIEMVTVKVKECNGQIWWQVPGKGNSYFRVEILSIMIKTFDLQVKEI